MACYILFQQDTERLARLEDRIQRYLRAEPSEFASISIAAGKVCSLCVLLLPGLTEFAVQALDIPWETSELATTASVS